MTHVVAAVAVASSLRGPSPGVLVGRRGPASRRRPAPPTPAFSLASGTIFSTRESPSIYLTFQQVERLDFRVYKVRDPMAFRRRPEGPAPARQPDAAGRPGADDARTRRVVEGALALAAAQLRATAVQPRLSTGAAASARPAARGEPRRTEQVNTFAQVPLLNPSQLVTSWREILPPMRDPDVRRIPLESDGPGHVRRRGRLGAAPRLHDRHRLGRRAWSARPRPARCCSTPPIAGRARRWPAATSA